MPVPAFAGTTLERWWSGVLDLVFPKRCLGCEGFGALLCAACRAGIEPLRPPFCRGCGVPARESPCPGCREAPLDVDGLRSIFPYDGLVRTAIIELKYHGLSSLGEELGGWMADQIRSGVAADLVTAVPLHHRRRRSRGYNQAELLARTLGRTLGLRFSAATIQRTKQTSAQAQLSDRAQRAENVRNAFTADPQLVKGRSVLIIDDVATTGATLSACARALKDAGATRVVGLTLARELLTSAGGVARQAETKIG